MSFIRIQIDHRPFSNILFIGLFCLIVFVFNVVCSDAFAHAWKNGKFAHPGESDSVEGYGEELGFVYGRAHVTVSYKKPTITCLVSGYICNYSGGLEEWPDIIKPVRWYFKPKSTITTPDGDEVVSTIGEADGWLDSYWEKNPIRPVYWWLDNYHHTLSLRGWKKGLYDVECEVVVQAKSDIDNDGKREIEEWKALVEGQIFRLD